MIGVKYKPHEVERGINRRNLDCTHYELRSLRGREKGGAES